MASSTNAFEMAHRLILTMLPTCWGKLINLREYPAGLYANFNFRILCDGRWFIPCIPGFGAA